MENNVDKKTHLTDILQIVFFLALLAIPTYFAYKVLLPKEFQAIKNISKEEDSESEESDEDGDIISDQEEAPINGEHYSEMFIEIGGQMAYIAIPTEIKEPATIVVYSHGSNTRVTTDTEDPFIQDLQLYGESFTSQNIIFAASNQHGENWGNQDSIDDTMNLINFVKDEYNTKEQIYMVGFSMGGLPTMHFTQEYPNLVGKIALLAPTTRTYEWNVDNVRDILDIDIQIWHGTADYNIDIKYSEDFVKYMKNLGKVIPLNKLSGKTHFDIDTEYMDEILEFFES